MLRNARSDIWWSMRAMANLAAVDHGGQKALYSWGGPAVSNPAVLAAASICRPSADSHEASIIQLLIRWDEPSRHSADRHARTRQVKRDGKHWILDEIATRCLHSVSHTNPSSSEQHVSHSNPSPMLSRLDIILPQPSSAIKQHPLFIKLKSFANTACHSNLQTVFAYSLIGGILSEANILSFPIICELFYPCCFFLDTSLLSVLFGCAYLFILMLLSESFDNIPF